MKGVIVSTEHEIEIRDFLEPLHRTIGEAVGGYIEVVHPQGLPEPYVMIVNEEGLLMDLPLNLFGSLLYGYGEHGHPIVGDVVIVKEEWGTDGIDLIGLSDKEAAALCRAIRKLMPKEI